LLAWSLQAAQVSGLPGAAIASSPANGMCSPVVLLPTWVWDGMNLPGKPRLKECPAQSPIGWSRRWHRHTAAGWAHSLFDKPAQGEQQDLCEAKTRGLWARISPHRELGW